MITVYLSSRDSNLLLVLIIIFQLRQKTEPKRSPIEYLHERFNQRFIKNDIISTLAISINRTLMRLQVIVVLVYPRSGSSMWQTCVVHFVMVR
jgi:hypothetical protein